MNSGLDRILLDLEKLFLLSEERKSRESNERHIKISKTS